MYKKLIILFTIICLGRSFANSQQIVITIPANPPANTSSWATSTPPFSITVTGTAQLAETNMLVFIKSASGNVVCGSNQAAAAQPTNIRPGQPKAWVGNNALALLGDNCVLPTGSYQLCVQIFGLKQDASGTKPIIEKCVPFEIRSVECTAPTPISPAHQKKFTISELIKPIIFRWTPLVMANKGIVVYRLIVWEVEDGQTAYEALYNNLPILTQDVKGTTQYIAPPSTFEKRTATYVWRVIALDREGNLICKNAYSEPTQFSVEEPPISDPTTPVDSSSQQKDSCCANKIDIKTKTVAVSPANMAAIAQSFNISPINIKYISAEIVSVKESVSDTSCMKCATHEDWIYNFVSHNTTAWNSGPAMNASPVNGSTYYPSKLIEWHCNQQGNLQFKFKIPLPENHSGCIRKSTICIRYKFVDINCITCEKIICYDLTN